MRNRLYGQDAVNAGHFSLLMPSGHCMYRQVYHAQTPRSAHTVYFCVLCESENKQRLFPFTALTDWFL